MGPSNGKPVRRHFPGWRSVGHGLISMGLVGLLLFPAYAQEVKKPVSECLASQVGEFVNLPGASYTGEIAKAALEPLIALIFEALGRTDRWQDVYPGLFMAHVIDKGDGSSWILIHDEAGCQLGGGLVGTVALLTYLQRTSA